MIYNSPTEKGNFHSLSIRVHVWFGLVWFCLINFVFCFGLIRCITGNRKTQLYCLTQSQNKKPRLSGNLETRSEIKLGGVKPSCDCWMYCVYRPYPPLLIADLSDMRESYIYWMLRKNSSVHSVAVIGLVTHWFSPHHHLHHQQLHLTSSSYPEKE